jgi:two-component system response regulator HydG
LVAATNADLEAAMRDGRFRRDLYHRINVIEINAPPLRDRLEDLPLLVAHFLRVHRSLRATPLAAVSDGALDALAAHAWPGNVRELENTVQRALVTAPGPRLEARDLRFAAFASGVSASAAGAGGRDGVFVPAGATLAEAEDRLIADTLERCRGDKERAAKMLGISARTLYRRANRGGPNDADPPVDAEVVAD